jgi:hypothetical protein
MIKQTKSPLKPTHVRGAIKASTDAGLTIKHLRIDAGSGELMLEYDNAQPPPTQENLDKERAELARLIEKDRILSGR